MADDGEEYRYTINGREPATVELIQSWARKAHGPLLSDEQATALARDVNHALFWSPDWRDENRAERENNPSLIRLRRIADALRTLKADLPGVIAESRRGSRSGDLSRTEALLDLVDQHSGIIEYCPSRGRGRAISLEKNLSTNLGRKVRSAWGEVATSKAVNAFAAIALSWLTERPVKTSDESVRRASDRRTKKAVIHVRRKRGNSSSDCASYGERDDARSYEESRDGRIWKEAGGDTLASASGL